MAKTGLPITFRHSEKPRTRIIKYPSLRKPDRLKTVPMITPLHFSQRIPKRNFFTLPYRLATLAAHHRFLLLFRLLILQRLTLRPQLRNLTFQRLKPSQSSLNLLLTLNHVVASIIHLHLSNQAFHAVDGQKKKPSWIHNTLFRQQ
jgi:hypothetical protein